MASPDELRARAFRLRAQGLSYQRIAEVIGVNRGTIHRWTQKHYAAWCAAQADAEREPSPPAPGEAPQPPSAPPEADEPAFRAFVTALQATGRYDIAAALAEVEPATIDRWRTERRRELERARATLVLRNARLLHQIAGSADATNRDRIAAVDRLLQWTAIDADPAAELALGPSEPPVPARAPEGPSDAGCDACPAETCRGHCPRARWAAFVDRVCWARSHPGATDAVALLGAGNLVSAADVGDWLEQGRHDLAAADDTPAARFATRWSVAVGGSISAALSAHASALSAGAGAATRAALDTLAAVAPEEYGGRGDPRRLSAGGDLEQPVARILRLSLSGGALSLDADADAAGDSES